MLYTLPGKKISIHFLLPVIIPLLTLKEEIQMLFKSGILLSNIFIVSAEQDKTEMLQAHCAVCHVT